MSGFIDFDGSIVLLIGQCSDIMYCLNLCLLCCFCDTVSHDPHSIAHIVYYNSIISPNYDLVCIHYISMMPLYDSNNAIVAVCIVIYRK